MKHNLVVAVPDKDFVGFSHDAKSRVEAELHVYSMKLIQQARYIESNRRKPPDGPTEINAGHVTDAIHVVGAVARPKTSRKARTIRLFAAALPLVLGIGLVPDKLKEQWYLFGFLAFAIITIIIVMLSILERE